MFNGAHATDGRVSAHPAKIDGALARVKITGAVATQSGNVADSGRDITKGDTKVAVKAQTDVVEFGRS